jgi:hypothetical protein
MSQRTLRELLNTDEERWLSCIDPKPMLNFLRKQVKVTRTKGGRRKLRLFGCGCCRRAWHALTEKGSCVAVEQAERYADRKLDGQELLHAWNTAMEAYLSVTHRRRPAALAAWRVVEQKSWLAAGAWRHTSGKQTSRLMKTTPEHELIAQASLLRCIFANPFRPLPRLVPSVLSWNDGTVAKLASAIYEERAFESVPILADALEEAGCSDEEILAHLRGPGPHVRGCWVLDLLLNKA